MLQTEGLTRHFEETVAVEDLNINVRAGEIYGFLGPNGAGKTTTIRLMLGLLEPTAGKVFLFGQPNRHNAIVLKRRIGVVAEEPLNMTRMTGWEFVRFFADLNGVAQPETRMRMLFEALDLAEARHALVAGYSRGMRQKLSLLRALVHKPDLLILDEPVSGLDPYGILQVRELVEEHRSEGGAVLISSHILSEIERSADRVGILHQGRLLVEDTVDGIRQRLGRARVVQLHLEEMVDGLAETLQRIEGVQRVEENNRQLSVQIATDADLRSRIFQEVVNKGGTLLEMRTEEMSLEEAFVTITHQNVAQLAGAA